MSWYMPSPILEFDTRRIDQGITFEWSGIEFASRYLRGQFPQWGLEGTDWWDGLIPDTETIKMPRGVRALETHLAARQITWNGLLETDPRGRGAGNLIAEMNQLRAANGTILRVLEGPVDMWREVICRKLQTQVTAIGERFATYTVTVQADDPLLYSAAELPLTSGSNTLTNTGDHESFPLVTIKGPASSAPRVAYRGGLIDVGRTLTASQTAIIDIAEGDVWVNNRRDFSSTSRDYQPLPVGDTSVSFGGGGTASIRRVSAWR